MTGPNDALVDIDVVRDDELAAALLAESIACHGRSAQGHGGRECGQGVWR
jgi:hypothetical protein